METEEVWEKIRELKPEIEDEIKEVIPENHHINYLYDQVHYHLKTGGKRWRPALCVLVCEALGGDKKKVLPFAAAIEIIHNFSLIHDDIEDQDEIRRDKPALWKKVGIPRAINVGDGMFAKSFVSASRSKEVGLSYQKSFKLMELLSKVVTSLMEGQAMDINSRDRLDITEEEYMTMISNKTGSLVGGSLMGGAIVADASDKAKRNLREFGEKIGPAFQITDDILDFSEKKGRGGSIGNDIREGKRSLMVVNYLQTSDDPTDLIDILDKPREETTERDVDKALRLLKKNNSIHYAKEKKNKLAREAISKLNVLPDNEESRYIEGMAKFLVERNF
ncbi:MAG: Geranylgeranyl pyrophosphate synthase IspA [Candidatus Methanohalarchaeum thermophilum]|uniref:Geranylgeranyl pyrophosphate synthase IspA n=1 Tax=Methanohalarchaeum thermophilum TaxID=1903181 RepID=A0A1Q6DU92_METT1|nr:MAG: Geranylgeranyl pyrophosphate synthase IspA [Candidatus Methanohalarchaeum thermophilum]